MTNVDNTTVAGGARPSATVKVWDLFVRLFHWSLVALFVIAYATGDEVERVHVAAGYAIGGLIVLRVVWGALARVTRDSALCPDAACGLRLFAATPLFSRLPAISAIIRLWSYDPSATCNARRHLHHRIHDDHRCFLGREMA